MAYNNRPLSPGGKRIQNPTRISDSRLNDASADQYQSARHSSYQPSKSSGGVVPISSETFVTYPSTQTSRTDQLRYDSYSGRPVDSYSGRPRQNSYNDSQRTSTSNSTLPSARNKPTVVQNDYVRSTSPPKGTSGKDYYSTTATSAEPRKETHRKVYSVADGSASLVADVRDASGTERHHKRRESNGGERGRHRGASIENDRDRAGRAYHLNGPTKSIQKNVNVDDAYSYTDAAGMFRDTEPQWREARPRARRNSIDRASGTSRERPVSMLDPAMDPRRPSKDIGPPPSMRGWDKINDAFSRSNSVRDRPRDLPQSPTRSQEQFSPVEAKMPQSPTRGRYPEVASFRDPRNPYYVSPRMPSRETSRDRYGNGNGIPSRQDFDFREPRPQERRNSMTRVPDRSVSRRGFGIREDSRDRNGRGSDESFIRENNYRDSGYAEPHRRDTVPSLSYYDEQRLEQEKRDRERQKPDERYVPRDKEPKRRDDNEQRYSRDDERGREQRYERDADYDVDRQREREREKLMQPQPEPERHHHRHGSYRDYDRKDISPRTSGEAISQPGLSSAVAGGAAGAAAAYGVGSYIKGHEDRGRERDRDRLESYAKPREYDQERLSPRPKDLRPPVERRSQESRSDEAAVQERDTDRHRAQDNERGLGFAFENPPEPSAKDRSVAAPTREDIEDRELERTHDDRPQADAAPRGVDPDEDYRRRLEKVQRELGRGSGETEPESDPDRERRRRDREQRLRERRPANDDPSTVGSTNTYSDTNVSYQMPGSYDNDSFEGSSGTERPTLRRRRSILDEPMPVAAGDAQIIDNTMSDKRENRVRIVDPPTEEEDRKPKGILKRPKDKFPDFPNEMREGVAPLKDGSKYGIPEGARWTKVRREVVNPEALQEAKERFEERQDYVIILRPLKKEEIQKLADRTREIRAEKEHEYRHELRAARRRERNRDRHDRDEYEDEDSEDEFKPRAPMLLEGSSSAGAPLGDREGQYASSSGRRDDR